MLPAEGDAEWAERVEIPALTREQRAVAEATLEALSSRDEGGGDGLLAATRVAHDLRTCK
jgi:hypothetical protein